MTEIDIEALNYFITTIRTMSYEIAEKQVKIEKLVKDYQTERGKQIHLQSKMEELQYKLDHERKENERLHETINGLHDKIEALKQNRE